MGITTRSTRERHTDTLLHSSVTQPSKINLRTANCNLQLGKKAVQKITVKNTELKKKANNENSEPKKKTTNENTQLGKKITNQNIQGKKKITDENTQTKKSVPLKRFINPKSVPDEGSVCKKYLKSLQKSSDVDLTKKAQKRAILKEKTNVIVSAEIKPLHGGVIPLPKKTNLRSHTKKNVYFDLQKEQKENVHIPVYKKGVSLQMASLYSTDVYDITKDEDFLLNEPQKDKVALNTGANKRNIKKSRVNQHSIKDSVKNINLKSKEMKMKNSSKMIITKNASKGVSVITSKNKPVAKNASKGISVMASEDKPVAKNALKGISVMASEDKSVAKNASECISVTYSENKQIAENASKGISVIASEDKLVDKNGSECISVTASKNKPVAKNASECISVTNSEDKPVPNNASECISVANSENKQIAKNASKGISVSASENKLCISSINSDNKPVEIKEVAKSISNSSATEIHNSITIIMDEIFSSIPVESVHAEESTEIINPTSPTVSEIEKIKSPNSVYHSTLSNTLRNTSRKDDSETKYYSFTDGKLDLVPPCTPEKEKQDTKKLLLDCCDVFEEMFPPPAMSSTPENDDKPIKEMAVLPGNSFTLRFSAIPHAASQSQSILDVPEFEPTLKEKEEITITLFDSPGKNEDTEIQNKSCGSEKEVKRKRQGKKDNCSVKRICKEASLNKQEESPFEEIQIKNRKSYSSPSIASWKRKCLNTSQKTFQSKTDKLIEGMNQHFLEFDSMELSIE